MVLKHKQKARLRVGGLFGLAILFLGAAAETSFASERLFKRIDTQMSQTPQLTRPRIRDARFDRAGVQGAPKTSFAQEIAWAIRAHLQTGRVVFDGYDALFHIPSARRNTPISLTSQPLCQTSERDAKRILRNSQALGSEELRLMQAFENSYNAASAKGKERHWQALMGCLAYTESLGDPDTSLSQSRARKLLGASYSKPPGVKFYYDKRHSNEASRWNIGLFQFVLHKGGNILPCTGAWKAAGLPASDTLAEMNTQEMGLFVGSPGQSFNAFCGVNKLTQSFHVQMLTERASNTHPKNRDTNGTLKPPSDRCASLHVARAYVHFGPFIRTVTHTSQPLRSNLHKLMACTNSALK